MTGEDLFDGQTRTIAADPGTFDEEHTHRSVVEEPPAPAHEDEDDYSVRIQRGVDAEETVETALVPFRPEDVTDDWTEHKLLPGQTRRQMVAQVRPTNAAGAIDRRGKSDEAALMEVTAPAQKAAPRVEDTTSPKIAVAPAPAPAPAVAAAPAPAPAPAAAAAPAPAAAAAPAPAAAVAPAPAPTPAAAPATADAHVWDGDAPTRACIELPDVADKGAVFEPSSHGARPDEATRMWDSAIALQRAPEWTLDVRQMYRELRTRARNAWATRRRLCILGIAVAVAGAFTTGAALWPTRAKPLAPLTRTQPRKPPSLHPAPGGDKATTPQEVDLLVARAVVAYDTGRRVESAEMFHTLAELQPDEQAWGFMSDILDRTNGGGAP